MMWPQPALTARSFLYLASYPSLEASLLLPAPTCSSRLAAECASPEGAVAPATWQSQSRGLGLKNTTLYGRARRASGS